MAGTNSVLLIDIPPSEAFKYEHYYCDYIELLALAANTDLISLSDVYDRFIDSGKITSQGIDSGSGSTGHNNSKSMDKWETRISDWYLNLKSRESEYGETYPYVVDGNSVKLKGELSDKNHLYIFLLLCANLRCLNKKYHSYLTGDFEGISLIAIKSYLPSHAESHRFGKSSNVESRYSGMLSNKIDQLASDIGCKTIYDDDDFSSHDTGDNGLDIVAWVPFIGDPTKSRIQMYLGQCATGSKWLSKQSEPMYIANSIANIDKAVKIMFTPYDARKADREFDHKAKLISEIMIDRHRLVILLDRQQDVMKNLESLKEVVVEAINYEEDIV